jgi:hypothetical protein
MGLMDTGLLFEHGNLVIMGSCYHISIAGFLEYVLGIILPCFAKDSVGFV